MENTDEAGGQLRNSGLVWQTEGVPRYRQIYEYLLQEISTGKIKPGDRMPSEKQLSAVFGVSRITGKKALEMLADNHMILRHRGRGSFVSGGTPAPAGTGKNASSFRSIAFLLPTFNNSFGNRLLCSVATACEALGYHLILRLTHESPDEEEKALHNLDDNNVAGILMIPVNGEHYNAEILRQILNKRPLVFVDRKMRGLPVPSISTDCVAASETAVRKLLGQGHRDIAFYSWPVIHTSTVEDRRQGFTRAFAGSGVSLNPAYICDNLPMENTLETIMQHLRDHPEISAAFTAQFEIALQVRRALAALDRHIPRDFALLTFDHPGYEEEYPDLICLQQDEDTIGSQAVEVLHRIIRGESNQFIGDILIPIKPAPGAG